MRRANRLINEKSPYLLQHAYNPVDWYPWASEAFDKARTENKPIFLSVGYSTCHWCHVMERESFESEEIAKVMNDLFVNVKVDRETMPDVDKAYMTFVQATTRSGGWPMSVWLTPELKPIYGGTYFPPNGTYGRPGFMAVCQTIGERWARDGEKLASNASGILHELREALSMDKGLSRTNDIPAWKAIDDAFERFRSRFDKVNGGFSDEPKFPTPVIMNFLLTYHWTNSLKESQLKELEEMSGDDLRSQLKTMSLDTQGTDDQLLARATEFIQDRRKKASQALEMTLQTLYKMESGGIHDHVGSGFHRYSTDSRWHVPHFEKMLYDQAQLLSAYANAYRLTSKELFKDTVDDIFAYCQENLLNESDGGYFSAEDADSLPSPTDKEKVEGAFAVWTMREVRDILGAEDSQWFSKMFGVEDDGNVDPRKDIQGELSGKNVLIRLQSLEEAAKQIRVSSVNEIKQKVSGALQKLKHERLKRPKPHLDDKIVTSWNALMISGLCNAFQALGNEEALKEAKRTAKFIEKNLYNPLTKRLCRSYRQGEVFGNTVCDDYAFMIQALIDLYESTFDQGFLKWANDLQKTQNELFWDNKSGGYFFTAIDSVVPLRLKDDHDGAEPCANSVALKNLIHLSLLLENKDYELQAEQLVSAFHDRLTSSGEAVPQMLEALILLKKSPVNVVIVGDEDTEKFVDPLHRHFFPTCIVTKVDASSKLGILYEKSVTVRNIVDQMSMKPSSVHVCKDFACGPRVEDPKELLNQLGA